MQLGEPVLVAFIKAENTESKCEVKSTQTQWDAILDGSSSRLGSALGNRPDASSRKDLSSKDWPSQAHHLVPHETLKKHPIKHWLEEGQKIWGDTEYDVDHKKNGMWMPYASSLKEWKTAAKTKKDRDENRKLMFEVMSLAQIQMHQSRHSLRNRYGIGEAPYHVRVNQYLRRVQDGMVRHEGKRPDGKPFCKDCFSKKKGSLYAPRENTIRFVDKASSLLKNDIKAMKIFVSRIAAEFAQSGGFD